jgi:hypothetical protein
MKDLWSFLRSRVRWFEGMRPCCELCGGDGPLRKVDALDVCGGCKWGV